MADESTFITVLRYIASIIPGNFLKTFFYLNFIEKPRSFFRLSLNSFYRMDHIYSVIKNFTKYYQGNFSILEFGVADGYSFTKKLYATKYLKVEEKIIIHGFDTFDGMPVSDDKRDKDLIANDDWLEGQFKTNFEELQEYCESRYSNFKLHKGLFSETLTVDFLHSLKNNLPILMWMDADYYTSTRDALIKLIPFIPNGCVIYFDEPEFNYGSRFTGEARLIYEINNGYYGDGIELIKDFNLSLNSMRIYRFINANSKSQYVRYKPTNNENELRKRTNDSPMP